MPITRCKDQKRQTLEEFYVDWASAKNQISADLGKSMLSIIDLINNLKSAESYQQKRLKHCV